MQGLVISGLYGNEWEILPVVDAVYSCGVDDLQKFSVTLPFRWSDDHEKPDRIRIDGILATEAESMQETPTGCVISGSCIDFEAVNATQYEKEDLPGTTFSAICSSLASEAGITITGASNTDIDRGGIEPGTALALLTDWADLIDKKQVTHYTNTSGDILKVGSAISGSNSVPAVMEWEGSHQEESYNSCTVTKISTVSEDKELVVSKVLDAREDKSTDPQMTQVYKSDFINNDDWDRMWGWTNFFLSCGEGEYLLEQSTSESYHRLTSQSYNTNAYLLAPFVFVDSYEREFTINFTPPGLDLWTSIWTVHVPSFTPTSKYPDQIVEAYDIQLEACPSILFKIKGYRYFEPKRDSNTILRIPLNIPACFMPPNTSKSFTANIITSTYVDPHDHQTYTMQEWLLPETDLARETIANTTMTFPASVFVCDGFIPTKIEWMFGSFSQQTGYWAVVPTGQFLGEYYGYGDISNPVVVYQNNNVTPPNIVHDPAWYYYWHLHRNISRVDNARLVYVSKDEYGEPLETPYIAFASAIVTSQPILNEHCSTYQRYDADDARTACLGPYNDSANHFMGRGPVAGSGVKDATARNSWNCKWVDIPEVNADYNWDELSLINAQHYASIFALGMYGTQAIDLSNSNTDTSLTRAQGSTPMRVYATTPNAETYEWGDFRAGSKPLNISSALFAHKGDRTDSEARRKYYNAKEEEYALTFTVPLSYFPTWASLFTMTFQNQTPVKISVSLLSETVTYYCQYASQGGFTLQ